MKLESKFDIGQTVYAIEYKHGSVKVQCPDCLGTRHWEATLPCGDVQKFQCPTCTRGYETTGTIIEHEYTRTTHELTIGKVDLDADRGFSYRCEETGVEGCWTNWREEKIFTSLDEAEAGFAELEADAEATRIENERREAANRKTKTPGDMLSYYRNEKRKALKALRSAEAGLAREAGA